MHPLAFPAVKAGPSQDASSKLAESPSIQQRQTGQNQTRKKSFSKIMGIMDQSLVAPSSDQSVNDDGAIPTNTICGQGASDSAFQAK